MDGKPSFLLIRFFTKYYFSAEVKEGISLFIATEVLDFFKGANCHIIFENANSFQRYHDKDIPYVKSVTNSPNLRPLLHFQVLDPGIFPKDGYSISEADFGELEKRLGKHPFLENLVIFI